MWGFSVLIDPGIKLSTDTLSHRCPTMVPHREDISSPVCVFIKNDGILQSEDVVCLYLCSVRFVFDLWPPTSVKCFFIQSELEKTWRWIRWIQVSSWLFLRQTRWPQPHRCCSHSQHFCCCWRHIALFFSFLFVTVTTFLRGREMGQQDALTLAGTGLLTLWLKKGQTEPHKLQPNHGLKHEI